MAGITCSACGSEWPDGFAFCGRCGAGLRPAATIPPPPADSPPPAAAIPPPPSGPAPVVAAAARTVRLLTLRGVTRDQPLFDVPMGRCSLGSAADLSLGPDPNLDAVHVVFERGSETLDVVAIPGRGGAFRRVRGTVMVRSGEVVFAGEQYLLVRSGESLTQQPAAAPGAATEAFGTPLPPPTLHVTQLLAGGLPGRVASTDREQLTIGRDHADMSFPQDRYMSGKHLRLQVAGPDQVQVVDAGSLNGTFVRMQRLPVRLAQGDEILVGGTLLRVDFELP
jgi:hypothetical protein